MTEREAKPKGDGAWGRTGELVRTYKVLHDPNGVPSWSIRFVGALAIVAILAAGAGAVFYAARDPGASSQPQFMTARVENAPDGTRTDYVGYDLAAARAPAALDAGKLEDWFRQWESEHAGATVLEKEPVVRDGVLVGWNVHYRP